MYACRHVGTCVCMSVSMFLSMGECTQVLMCVLHDFIPLCMHITIVRLVCVCLCVYVTVYACMYECIMYAHTYV